MMQELKYGSWRNIEQIGTAFHTSVAEEENQVHACAFDAALGQTVGDAARFRRDFRIEAQEFRELVVEHELREAALPELLLEFHERLVGDLLAKRDAPRGLTRLRIGGRDLEEIDVERLADR